METPSEENQDQRQDKRGTNECSQRASSVLFTAVFTGALTYSSLLGFTLHNSWVDFAQQGLKNFKCQQHSILVSLFVCTLLVFQFQLQLDCASLPLQKLSSLSCFQCVFFSFSAVYCLCLFYDLISLSLRHVFIRPRSCSRRAASLPLVIITPVSLLRTMSLLQNQRQINQTSGCILSCSFRGEVEGGVDD